MWSLPLRNRRSISASRPRKQRCIMRCTCGCFAFKMRGAQSFEKRLTTGDVA